MDWALTIAEQKQLGWNFDRLSEFTESPECTALPESDRELIAEQLRLMARYMEILATRIDAWKRQR